MTIGNNVIKTWSTTQGVIALSSGEAEFYGIVKGAGIALGILGMMKDFDVDAAIAVKTDASAAKGIANRRGLGKVRHIEVSQLWVQEQVSRGMIHIEKVAGPQNIADALTKHVESEGIEKHMSFSSQHVKQGRHSLAPLSTHDM